MKFSEKLYRFRAERRLTQAELAKKAGISLKSVTNYEAGTTLPRTLEIYERLAAALECDVQALLCENERFMLKAKEKYGHRGKVEAKILVEQLAGLFAGGEMAVEDMEEMMLAVQEAYFIAKQKNKKYAPKSK